MRTAAQKMTHKILCIKPCLKNSDNIKDKNEEILFHEKKSIWDGVGYSNQKFKNSDDVCSKSKSIYLILFWMCMCANKNSYYFKEYEL